MIQDFRGKNTKDIETAFETIIHNFKPFGKLNAKTSKPSASSVSNQLNNVGNFDSYIEKRSKE